MRRGLVDPRGWVRMNRWLGKERAEILHAHLPHAAWMARWSRLAAPVRVVIDTIHTSALGTWGRGAGYRWSGWLPDRVTAVGEGVREAWVQAGMVGADQCTVVPNGVDTDLSRPDGSARSAKRASFGPRGFFLWFAAGRLEAVKDYSTMLQAFAQIPDASRLVIAGSGLQEPELRGLAASLKIADRVRFLGFEQDVRGWMQASDGFVLSSRREGLPMGLIEAASCGLPAVATDVPGTREVILEGKTGWLVPAKDPALLAAKLIVVMKAPPAERREMGERARKRAVELFSLKGALDRWEELYRGLLDRNPKPRRWAS
jgi:glycosyltransferase involved in cell wall biosynthesis